MRNFALLFLVGVAMAAYVMIMQWLKKNPRSTTRFASRATPATMAPPRDAAAPSRYIPQGRIMSENEAAFFRLLRSTFGESYLIFAQLPLDLVVSPERGDRSAYTTALNRIDRKTVDFALVDPETMVVSVVIELNDSSHNRRDRQERDTLVRDALAQAKVRFVEIRAAAAYNAASLGPLLTNTRG